MDSSHVLTAHPHLSSPASPDRLARPIAALYPLPSPRQKAPLWLFISGFLLFILSRIQEGGRIPTRIALGWFVSGFHGPLNLGKPAVVWGPPGQCQSTSRKGMPGKRGGKEERSSLVEYGGSPQGNPQQMQWIMKKYNAVWQAVYLTEKRVSEWGEEKWQTNRLWLQPATSGVSRELSPSSSACAHSRDLQPLSCRAPLQLDLGELRTNPRQHCSRRTDSLLHLLNNNQVSKSAQKL